MRSFYYFLFLILFSSFTRLSWARCDRPELSEKPISPASLAPRVLFSSAEHLRHGFEEFMKRGQRLNRRAYRAGSNFKIDYQLGPSVDLPLEWIEAIKSHLIQSLSLGYADYIFYSDLGHVHIFESTEDESPELLFLYHSGEMFEYRKDADLSQPLSQDPWMQWRYLNRNLVGYLDPKASLEVVQDTSGRKNRNLVDSFAGYKSKTTLYFSSHHDGCFQISDKTNEIVSFDIGF